jgi:hypothetical protein
LIGTFGPFAGAKGQDLPIAMGRDHQLAKDVEHPGGCEINARWRNKRNAENAVLSGFSGFARS